MADWIWMTLLVLSTAGAGALGYTWGRRDERDRQAEQRRLRKAARAALLAAVPTQPPPVSVQPTSAQVAAGTLAAAGASAAAAVPSPAERLGREIADHVPALRRSREVAMADTAIMEPRPQQPAPFFADTQVQEP
jgi:hypothetical protein